MRRRKFVNLGGISRLVELPVGPYGPPPVAGYQLWLDGDDAGTIAASGGKVSQWNDKSGNGYHATQGTAASRPVWGYTVNHRRALIFGGTSFMSSSCPWDDRTSTTFFAGGLFDFLTYRTMFGANANGGNCFRFDQTTGLLHTEAMGTTAIFTSASQVPTFGQMFVAAQVLTATTVEHRLNLTSESTSNATAFSSPRTMDLGINAGVFPWNGPFCEILNYPTTLVSGDVDKTIAYLMSKWDIS